ncbi:hypothetical protein I6Y99_004401 [Vibrio parahaemolyticus]|uniref:hypothetical protein n=1 Tax=Vibrio parahaemolyticus TaxID=670 RepID=UPI000C998674|nr:hypothetical protein [Vibrio parahaemolyticus]EGQ7810357.1 hypothetical protein [Vibrio parahaemolyticus]PMS91940.1 hypothetical protein C1T06_22885 [Vibrio parahaemolyticus]
MSDAEYKEFKKQQRLALKAARVKRLTSPEKKKVEKKVKPVKSGLCRECRGKRTQRTLFSTIECEACFGTGLDVSNAESTIRYLFSLSEKLKDQVENLEHDLFRATTTEEERLAMCIADFRKGRHLKGD